MQSNRPDPTGGLRRIGLLAATGLLILVSCGGDGDGERSVDTGVGSSESLVSGNTSTDSEVSVVHTADGTIRYAFSLETPTLDPGYITSLQAALYLNPVYDRLTYIDPLKGTPGPMLATEWVVGADDESIYVDFTLQEGLVFPDGAEFGPDTVVANIERSKALEGQGVSSDLALVIDAEMVSPNVVRIRVSSGAAALPAILGSRAGMMISQDALNNPDLATNPVGIGMWTLERFDPSKVSYTATPDYWDPDVQRSDRLELFFIPDDSARFNALRAGDLDVTFLRPSQLETAQNVGLNVLQTQGATNYIYMLNTSVEPLDDPKVRRALQYAIDREGISDALLGGRCTPNDQIFSPASPYFDSAREQFPYDPEEAVRLLAEAGYGEGFSIDLMAYDVDFYRRLGEVIQAQFAAIGIVVNLAIAPISESRDRFVLRQDVDGAPASPGLEADPSYIVRTYLLPNGTFNPGNYENPLITGLAANALETSDQSERQALYNELSNVASDDSPFLAICSPAFLFASKGEIDGFVGARAAGAPEWRGVAG